MGVGVMMRMRGTNLNNVVSDILPNEELRATYIDTVDRVVGVEFLVRSVASHSVLVGRFLQFSLRVQLLDECVGFLDGSGCDGDDGVSDIVYIPRRCWNKEIQSELAGNPSGVIPINSAPIDRVRGLTRSLRYPSAVVEPF